MQHLDSAWGELELSGKFFLDEGDVLDSVWKNGKLHDAEISGGSLTGSVFEDCTFTNVTFTNIFMDDVDFVRCHFENFRIVNCSREGIEMRECTGSPPTLIGTKAGV